MRKQRSTVFNIATTIITKFILLFGGFIVSVILARLLGPEGKGIITAVFVFPLLIISLADMGIRQSTAYLLGTKKYKPSDIISSIGFLWILTSTISMLLVLIYFIISPSNEYPWLIIGLAIASIPVQLINQYSKGVMLGENRIGIINLSQLINLITNLLSILILVWILDLGVLGAALVQITMATVTSIYYLFNITKQYRIRFSPVDSIPKELITKGFSFAIALFVISLNYKIDILILDSMVTPEEVGVYSIGVNFAELLWQIPAAIGTVIFSKSATTQKVTNSVIRSTTILRIVLPIMLFLSILIALFAPLAVTLLYGNAFAEAGSILRILLPGILFITISKILHPDLAGRGEPLFAVKIFSFSLFINIILNFVFIPSLGIDGAAFASTISYIVAGFSFAYLYSRKEKIPLKNIFVLNRLDIDHMLNIFKSVLRKGKNNQ